MPPAPPSPHLRHSEGDLLDLAARTVARVEAMGLGACARVTESGGLMATARGGRAEIRTGDQGQRLELTVYDGLRRGHAGAGRFDAEAVAATIERASALARFGGEDAERALPRPDTLELSPRRPALFASSGWSMDELVAQAVSVEAAALETAEEMGVEVVVDAAGVHSHDHRFAMAATNGFRGAYSSSTHGRWCSVAAGAEGARRMGGASTSRRDPAALREGAAVGAEGTRRAAARLGSRAISSRRVPVLLENLIAHELPGALAQALSGDAQMNASSFLLEALGDQATASHLTLREDPYLPFGAASAPFDGEGVAGLARDVVHQGVVEGYFLDTRSGRRLGMASTGSANGPYNLTFSSNATEDGDDLTAMLRKLDHGLFVTALSGQGVNRVSGAYSRAASGFWVEGGEIAFPVEGITLVGDLRDMLRDIVAVGADVAEDGPIRSGSILIERMDIAGL